MRNYALMLFKYFIARFWILGYLIHVILYSTFMMDFTLEEFEQKQISFIGHDHFHKNANKNLLFIEVIFKMKNIFMKNITMEKVFMKCRYGKKIFTNEVSTEKNIHKNFSLNKTSISRKSLWESRYEKFSSVFNIWIDACERGRAKYKFPSAEIKSETEETHLQRQRKFRRRSKKRWNLASYI